MTIMSNPPGLMQDAASSYARNQPRTTAAGAVQQERDASGWERAMAANAARLTAEAQQQIEDARAEPTVAEREAQAEDAQLRRDVQSIDPYDEAAARATPPDTLTLSGAKLAAYRQLESAASAAAEAQRAMTTTGVALRDAIQAMCAAMTGVK